MVKLIFLVCVAAFSRLAQGAAGGGSIQGTVKDATGAILPGATLAIRHLASGRTFNTVANADGFFVIPAHASSSTSQ